MTKSAPRLLADRRRAGRCSPRRHYEQPPMDAADDVAIAQSTAAAVEEQSIGSVLPGRWRPGTACAHFRLAWNAAAFRFHQTRSDPFNNFRSRRPARPTWGGCGRRRTSTPKLTLGKARVPSPRCCRIHGVGLSNGNPVRLGPVSDLEAVASAVTDSMPRHGRVPTGHTFRCG